MTKKADVKKSTEFLVPLNKLKKSPKNVRKVPHSEADIAALAASIAANGLLQNLVVEPEVADGKETGNYLANIGEGRRLALLSLAKSKRVKKDEPVRCVLGEPEKAEEVSLAENVIRARMHPADEYEAFAFLHNAKGMAADDIATRFGVHVALVRQRLRLGAVSPVLMALYREAKLTLEQLMAFTVTDDHARQEQVWHLLDWNNEPSAIRRALTEGQVPGNDRRAVFVGTEAYEAAGGIVTRDLFDEENGGYFAEAALLDKLVATKLEQAAQDVRNEGWAWVIVTAEFDHRATSDMRRVYPQPAEISAKNQRKIDKLSSEHDELVAIAENEELTEAIQIRLDELEAEIEALKGASVYDSVDIAAGGAFVSLGFEGGLRVERGFIRKEKQATVPVHAADIGAGEEEGRETSTSLPDRLIMQLTAQRTQALREAVANRPDVAFVAVVHAFAVSTFYVGAGVSCLDVGLRSYHLSGFAPGIDEGRDGCAIRGRHEALGSRLPGDVDNLWEALLTMRQEQLMELLAHCAALTIDCVVRMGGKSSNALKHTEVLAQAVSLEMTQRWQPTKANYLGQVTKAVIMEAVREGVSPQAAENIAALKKPAMAEAAEQLLANKGWLPEVLRLPQPQSTGASAA